MRAAPAFAWRGIVEGEYGTPWDHAARTQMLRFEAAHGMNVYIHAPKFDLYERTHWRDPYPAAQQREFDAEIALARALGVQWVEDISPGLPEIPTPQPPQGVPSPPVCYSCTADVQALMTKLAPFLAAGERTFMISFDDVVKALTYPQDIARYGQGDEAYGRANGEFLSAVLHALRAEAPDVQLVTVGADYSGTADTAYLDGLRATLDPAAHVVWTGTGVGSADFTAEQARAYGSDVGRAVIVWDNWTVTDIDGQALGASPIAFFGPYVRTHDLGGAVDGFLLNPDSRADLNLIGFASAAAWLADPGIDPRAAWLAGVRDLAGTRAAESLRAFAETSYLTRLPAQPGYATEAPTFVARATALLHAYDSSGAWPGPASELGDELRLVTDASGALGKAPALTGFLSQAAPYLHAATLDARAGLAAAALLRAERPALSVVRIRDGWSGHAGAPDPAVAAQLRAGLEQAAATARTDPYAAYGPRPPAFDELAVYDHGLSPPDNVMDDFISAVQSRDQSWMASDAAPASSSPVRVTLNGTSVTVEASGNFTLPADASGVLEAIDGAGKRTKETATGRRQSPLSGSTCPAAYAGSTAGAPGAQAGRVGAPARPEVIGSTR